MLTEVHNFIDIVIDNDHGDLNGLIKAIIKLHENNKAEQVISIVLTEEQLDLIKDPNFTEVLAHIRNSCLKLKIPKSETEQKEGKALLLQLLTTVNNDTL